MGYVRTARRFSPRPIGPRGRGDVLGNPLAIVSSAITTFNTAQTLLSSIGSIFGGGGKSRDAARKARCDFFAAAAEAGCVTAARYLLAGVGDVTATTERPAYKDAVARLASRRPDVLAEAERLRPLWIGSDDPQAPAASQQMIVTVQRELQTLQSAAAGYGDTGATVPAYVPPAPSTPWPTSTMPPSANPTGRPTTTLPPMQTTAPFNWAPYAIGAAIVGGLLFAGERK